MIDHSDILQLCRLCLVEEKVNHSIFEEAGGLRGIFLKITSCLPVSISQDDSLPKKICDSCSSKLDTFYQFWNETANAEKQLLQWLNQTTLGPISKAGQTETKHKMDSAEVKEEAVDVGDGGFDDMKMSSDAQTYVLQQQQLPYSTPSKVRPAEENNETEEIPPKRPRRASAIKALEHMGSEEEDDPDYDGDNYTKAESDDSEKDEEDDEDETYREGPSTSMDDQPGTSGMTKGSTETPCNYHGNNGGPSVNLMDFIKAEVESDNETDSKDNIETNHEDKESPENSPNDEYKSDVKNPQKAKTKKPKNVKDKASALRRQLMKKSDVDAREANNPVHCDICDVTYKNSIMFAFHSIQHNEDKKYSCHLCTFRSTSKYHTEMHIRAHEGTSKYKCEICNKAFTVSTHAVEHKYFHTGEKPFQCEICGKHFMFSWFLTSHRRSQHWEIMTGMPLVKYDCQICNKHYTSASGLKRHQRAKHELPGPQVSVLCDICGKSLSSKEKLKFHRRIHTGFKPYGCEICTKSFSRKEQLKEHERVHTGEKPYICGFCGKGFSQRSPLRIHERTHTGERPYVCRLCGRGFISKGVMDSHMKNCSVVIIP